MNFSEVEKKLLFDLVMRNREVIENPKNDPPTQAMKGKKWAEITNEFNKFYPENKKTIDQMRNAWELTKRSLSDPKLYKMSAAVGGSGEPVYDDGDKAQRSKTKRRNASYVNQEEIRKYAERRLMLEAKKVKELTKSDAELHTLDVAEQKLRVAIAKEQLNQEKLRTKLMNLSMELEQKERERKLNPQDDANLGSRAIQLAARLRERRVMNKTKNHQELREIAKKEQEVRIMITKELLEQEKIKTQYLQNKVKEQELKLKMYNKK